jgi:DNA repair exonuclease SbcCD nuclease subunit
LRFAVLADAHIGRSIPLAVAEHRRRAFEAAFTRAVDEVVSAGVDYAFICGDLFERRTLRPRMVQFVHDELYRMARQTEERHGKHMRILVVRGNHDGRPQSDALDYIKHPLAGYLHVFGDEDIVYRDGGLHVVGLNYHDQIDRAFDLKVRPAFEGAKGLKVLMLHGFVDHYNEVPPQNSYLTLDQLASVSPDFVFTGHYHRRCMPKRLRSGGWIITPGSLEVYDFAETPDKGFYIVEAEGPEFRWVPIEPLHIMSQKRVESDRARPPSWYEDRILGEVRAFVSRLREAGKQGYLRVKVRGRLSEGWPSDISMKPVERIMSEEPLLLWVDRDTMELDLPESVARPQPENQDVAAYFSGFGAFAEEIREMHGRVRETLEEEASTQTGLLTPTQRAPLVQEWVRRLEAKRFGEAEP